MIEEFHNLVFAKVRRNDGNFEIVTNSDEVFALSLIDKIWRSGKQYWEGRKVRILNQLKQTMA
jgi:hypothetical protein